MIFFLKAVLPSMAQFLLSLLLTGTGVWAYDSVLVPDYGEGPFHFNYTVIKDLAGKDRNGYLGVFTSSAPNFHTVAAGGTCLAGAPVQKTAIANKCIFATNGGPFNYQPLKKSTGCSGVLISDGKTLASNYKSSATQFGVTKDKKWFIGNLKNASEGELLGITNLITGFNWLVYNGSATISKPGGEGAPRTVVGIDQIGRLMMLEVDGCEKCKDGKGPTMKEISDIMVNLGSKYAVNLDGGGSSTSVVNGTVVNHPTCVDVILKCQRRVTSVVCVT
jgi:exopolysaccharide biosynthesis protein